MLKYITCPEKNYAVNFVNIFHSSNIVYLAIKNVCSGAKISSMPREFVLPETKPGLMHCSTDDLLKTPRMTSEHRTRSEP